MEIHLAPMASAYQAQPRRAEGITSISGRNVQAIFCRRRHQPRRPRAARLLLCVLGQLVVYGPHIADRTATLVLRAARPEPCLDVAVQLKEHSPSIAVVLHVDVHTPLRYFEKGGTIHTQATR